MKFVVETLLREALAALATPELPLDDISVAVERTRDDQQVVPDLRVEQRRGRLFPRHPGSRCRPSHPYTSYKAQARYPSGPLAQVIGTVAAASVVVVAPVRS